VGDAGLGGVVGVANRVLAGCVGVVNTGEDDSDEDDVLRSEALDEPGESGAGLSGSGRRKGEERGVPRPRGDGLYGDDEAEADCVGAE
jgi:hypothetical protein